MKNRNKKKTEFIFFLSQSFILCLALLQLGSSVCETVSPFKVFILSLSNSDTFCDSGSWLWSIYWNIFGLGEKTWSIRHKLKLWKWAPATEYKDSSQSLPHSILLHPPVKNLSPRWNLIFPPLPENAYVTLEMTQVWDYKTSHLHHLYCDITYSTPAHTVPPL